MAKKLVLVVDDEKDVRDLVRFNLENHGYRTAGAATGEAALQKARAEPPDLIVLDLMLPGIDGLEVCRALKRDHRTAAIPVIMLTAKGEEVDIVTGLELGADDYVVKPFSPRVFIARVRTVLRSRKWSSESADGVVKLGDLLIDPARREVKVENRPVELTCSEFMILQYLARRPGRVYTRNQIIEAVHGDDYPVTERSIDVQIVGLRKKLGGLGEAIETVRGVGYRFRE